KGALREVPFTLKRWIRGVYAFSAFLLGCCALTVYGFILFGGGKKLLEVKKLEKLKGVGVKELEENKITSNNFLTSSTSERKKLRFHRVMQWVANFVIRRVPGTTFHYENLSGETFEKPAVIISNHQSHLDLMCLLMLTPKLIILTNDWVWNSPFFGKMIRYAEFYPVSQGFENALPTLANAVQRGYSIVVFPEGTRSADSSILRFHRGAFYLAEQLQLDIIPVFLHGAGHVLPKTDFMLREGRITVQVRERITPNDSRFAADYATRSKQVRRYYSETCAEISKEIETPEYFKSFVLHNYMYKGADVWRGVTQEFEKLEGVKEVKKLMEVKELGENRVLIENNGYGVYSFLYALTHKNVQVIAVDDDEDKVATAKHCAGIPRNLTIYHTSEWTNTL
ncbi:MAG: 1-acyl-sn-glycerol-3-phosphate acyltransferase, partial [Bacteroidales bacterium]|nr:1-acyl-sn-glycerol-3-phosphate acyltransferase [Bacteroidales bacterium]